MTVVQGATEVRKTQYTYVCGVLTKPCVWAQSDQPSGLRGSGQEQDRGVYVQVLYRCTCVFVCVEASA